MTGVSEFYESIVNSLTEHIVIVDDSGAIRFVNSAWVKFGKENNSPFKQTDEWLGISYLNACDFSAEAGDLNGHEVAVGLRKIINTEIDAFYHEYPCHSATEKRWFMMRISPLRWSGPSRFVVSHQNITERKLAEEKVQALSMLDGLTGIPNRRRFDEFLDSEWKRAMRMNSELSLLLLDVDHFKKYNDRYGHAEGDECLKQIAKSVSLVGQRPSDLPARYGGEEFALIMGDSGADATMVVAERMLKAIFDLALPHATSGASEVVTASIGVATLSPNKTDKPSALIEAADAALYRAKNAGRNQVSK